MCSSGWKYQSKVTKKLTHVCTWPEIPPGFVKGSVASQSATGLDLAGGSVARTCALDNKRTALARQAPKRANLGNE